MEYVIIVAKKGKWVRTTEIENIIIKKYKKAEKAINGDEDVLVLCLLMTEIKKKYVKKKVQLAYDVKKPSEADMMSTINGDTFFLFTKNTWIVDSSASCYITNKDTSLFNMIDINESIQGSYSIMPAT